MSDKPQILEVCRFASAKHPEGNLSLERYLAERPEGQDTIYYLIGEDAETMQKSPQLEGFLKRGMDVLFFTDHVDNFWVNLVHQYQDVPMLSVTKAQLRDEESEARKKNLTPTDAELQQEQALDQLLKLLGETYGDAIKQVRLTAKLADSPVCLAVGEADMDIRMERFLVENKQLPGAAAKILEINPTHPVITRLAEQALKEGRSAAFDDTAWLLLDQARIVEGQEVPDPAAFARRLTALLQGV
jgi:molecular chaperone HtpG